MTSAFIIEVHSQLQPDPNEETAALLRVLLHKMDNTTFGDDVPAVPQWSGPPHTIIQVQTMLFASLAASLFAAFLATLGKQWLNRYASTGIRGTPIDRSHNRQHKLNGVVTWYFNHVMESIPLMLQIALLLLGCALSRYLWEIDTTIASVTIGVTSFGVLFYLFIVVAGSASPSCPYQTPGAHTLHFILHYNFSHTLHHILHVLWSSSSVLLKCSHCYDVIMTQWALLSSQQFPFYCTIMYTISLPFLLPLAFAMDTFNLGLVVVQMVVGFALRVYSWYASVPSNQTHGFNVQIELQCISWMLQTSLDEGVQMLALRYLFILMVHGGGDPNPNLVVGSFKIITGHIEVIRRNVVDIYTSEPFVKILVLCSTCSLDHLSSMSLAPEIIAVIQQCYIRVFPSTTVTALPASTHSVPEATTESAVREGS